MSAAPTNPASESSNRLGSTLFLMALAHGILILGVTFTSDIGQPLATSTLKVTLVSPRNQTTLDSADFIANQTTAGGRDTNDASRATAVVSTFELADIVGDPRSTDLRDATPEPRASAQQLVTSRPSDSRAAADPNADVAQSASVERAISMQNENAPETSAAILDLTTEIPDSESESDEIGPSTRQSILANYLNGWRARVERIGTLNFPRQFLVGNTATRRPRLEVAIGPDGSLKDIVVQDSSGDRAVDQAAVSILRLAAPFDPLPPEILAEYETLRFAYEWEFIQADR